MYYMIHATDHEEAPALMSRAYERAVQPKEAAEQLFLEFESLPMAQPLYADSKPFPEVYIETEDICDESIDNSSSEFQN